MNEKSTTVRGWYLDHGLAGNGTGIFTTHRGNKYIGYSMTTTNDLAFWLLVFS